MGLVILGVLGGAAWWLHRPLLARYYVNQLAQATDVDLESCVANVIALDEVALPYLLTNLDCADKKVCDNSEYALVGLVGSWAEADPRSVPLLEQITARFQGMSPSGKHCALQLPVLLLKKTRAKQQPQSDVVRLAGSIFALAIKGTEPAVGALQLGAALLEHETPGRWLEQCRALARDGLKSGDDAVRVAAIQLICPPLRQENEVLARVVPFLKDTSASVRKAALVVLSAVRDLVSDEGLLPSLHDADEEVQTMCELALRSRGLQESHIVLARYISAERPDARLQVFQHLREAPDLDPGIWLRRLCQYPRGRAGGGHPCRRCSAQADLRDCLTDMAEQDPSATVRWLAAYYLSRYQPAGAE